MSKSESDFESNSSDDTMEDETFDDRMIDMYDDNDDDDYCNFDDTHHFMSLGDIILGEVTSDRFEVPLADIPSNYSVRLAMHSKPHRSVNLNSTTPFVNDSILTYLTAPPLIRKIGNTGKYCLAIDPTVDESGIISLSTPQLYVGNIPSDTKWQELKNWFIEQSYGVSRVDLKTNKKGARYAFVRFDSIQIAVEVLYKSEKKSVAFVFHGKKLDIKRINRSSQPPANTLPTMTRINSTPTSINFKITDIHYGTLITGAAMRNIQTGNSIVSNVDQFGIIAHRLIPDQCKIFELNIDIDKKKLAISGKLDVILTSDITINTGLKFEWNFRDLKSKKITPVLINQKEVFLLVELKRPPIILEIRNTSHSMHNNSDESRLPGFGPIGHANAWLFKLSSQNLRSDYMKLFEILRRQNLSPRQFSESNIIHLIGTTEAARKNLDSVLLISNDEWIEQNQVKVNDFLNHRWPSYPFETKFEIMKLISKHIITVNDLIVDEQAEHILKMCTISTLIALTDKIVGFAPRWFATTCENEDEDWNNENEEQQVEQEENQLPISTEDLCNDTNNLSISQHIRSCTTGKFINTADTEIASRVTFMTKPPLIITKRHIGTFSRLLISAFEQLLKKYELCRTQTTGIYVTKLELRTANAEPFLIRKIYITPSTVLYEGPYREEKCAVTRHYVQHQNRFLRITFRDEDYRVLRNYHDNMTKIYERIKKILINGINICDRNYEFLAFSSSQLREHSCWMFASADDGTTVNTIRSWMGDFRNVRPVAKLAARLGQSFSTSIKGIQLESRQRREISDVIHFEVTSERRHEHCFTDGIGIITSKFAKILTQEMKLSGKICPCAFQIRCGGYKGMVCLDVSGKITNPDEYVHFRKSMNKFTTEKNLSIDVVRTSLNPSVAYLNRQIILLLSSLGIPNSVFISLQDHMLQQLKALTENSHKACESLKELNEFGGHGYHGFLIAYLKSLGERKDPFVRQLLFVIKAFLVKELRTKAKIRVPNSWSLLGVVDESRTLQYGQVFIQIDNSNNQQTEGSRTEIFQGPVVVTRNPCFHPGDIRKLEAVDISTLHELKNVIVFPMKEPRPHPKEMSGGDLDGDTFWISRHSDLIFNNNEYPFDYQDQDDEADKIQSGIIVQHSIKDVCNFFGEYIAADNLGLIANSHLAFADQLERGAKNEKCLQLAKMHSVAVDFAKKGVNAPSLTRELRPTKYPHYMEKKDKPTYQSQTILGKLYDAVIYYNSNLFINEEEEISATSSFPYESFFINGNAEYIKDARIIKSEYDRDIKRIMRQYGIEHEVEVVSGYILKFTSKQYAKETKIFDLRNEITHAYRVIQDKYLRLFWEEFYPLTDESQEEKTKWSEISKKLTWKNQLDVFEYYNQIASLDEAKKKASAWFHITYQPWIIHIKKYQKNKNKKQKPFPNNQQTEQPTQFKGLFSFAWKQILFYGKEQKKSRNSNKNQLSNEDNGSPYGQIVEQNEQIDFNDELKDCDSDSGVSSLRQSSGKVVTSVSRTTIPIDDDLDTGEDCQTKNPLYTDADNYDRRESDLSSMTNFTHTMGLNEFRPSSRTASRTSSVNVLSPISSTSNIASKQSSDLTSTKINVTESKGKNGVRKFIQRIFKSSSSTASKNQGNTRTLVNNSPKNPALNIDEKRGTAYSPLSPLPITQGPIRLLVIRHGERLDRYYSSQWLRQAFDKDGNFCRFSPILPETLPFRASIRDFDLDPPLTYKGLKDAYHTGTVLKEKSIHINYCYSSPALRCVQTAAKILEGLQLQNRIKIRIEPGLFECTGWYTTSETSNIITMPRFMTKKELLENKYSIDKNYREQMTIPEVSQFENELEFYQRSHAVAASILKMHEQEHITQIQQGQITPQQQLHILFIAHAPSLETCTRKLCGGKFRPDTLPHVIRNVDFLTMTVIEKTDNNADKWIFRRSSFYGDEF
ncbi:unnamed protein product [Rotaria sordida]|uniref:RNA-directed RNA polymerase n=1 Tax=Rotaria sordida TaxID=392033 RepID=A0A818RWE6_9BILA|nr:unnamed protein product [Rotaria sordida]